MMSYWKCDVNCTNAASLIGDDVAHESQFWLAADSCGLANLFKPSMTVFIAWTKFLSRLKPAIASTFSHSIMAEVLVVEAFQPLAKFFAGALGSGGSFLGGFQDFFFYKDGAIDP